MNIVIAGAGDVGFHLAELLANENQNITLIDLDESVLQYANNHLDVLTVHGDASSIQVLKDSKAADAHLFIAATTHETTNLLAAKIAKELGAKKTISRIKKLEYLQEGAKNLFKEMGVDNLFAPNALASQEIERLIEKNFVTDVFDFDNGCVSILGIVVDKNSRFLNKKFVEFNEDSEQFKTKIICLLREGETMIPTEDMIVQEHDHVYLSTNSQNLIRLNHHIGNQVKAVKKVMIVGGSDLALQTALKLQKNYQVKMVVKNEERCKEMLSTLDKVLIINGEPSNIDLLKEVNLDQMDAMVALTKNTETNIISCITAEQMGVHKTIALVHNSAYIPISHNIGVDTLINTNLIAANNIFRYVRKGKVEAIASMHGLDAEIIEFEIHKKNRLINVPIKDLHIPKETAKVAGVVRMDKGLIPDENFQLELGDKIIVLALPQAIKKIERIFK